MPAAKALTYRIDPFDLRLFTEVLERGTITAAARAAHLSLAATSARLKALEDAVGVTLLVRAKAGATPTDAGRALARHAHRVLADLETLHLEMASFGRGLRGTVRVMGNTAAVAEALPARLGTFLAKHPDLDVHLEDFAQRSGARRTAPWRGGSGHRRRPCRHVRAAGEALGGRSASGLVAAPQRAWHGSEQGRACLVLCRSARRRVHRPAARQRAQPLSAAAGQPGRTHAASPSACEHAGCRGPYRGRWRRRGGGACEHGAALARRTHAHGAFGGCLVTQASAVVYQSGPSGVGRV